MDKKILNKILKMLSDGTINAKDEPTVISAIQFMEKHPDTLHEDYIKSTEEWFKAIIKRKGAENILKSEKTELQK